jgi:hypothetical protein
MQLHGNKITFENVEDLEDVERLLPIVKRFLLDGIDIWEGDIIRIVKGSTGILVIYKNKNFKETINGK